jgi:hypothetical protein
MSDVNALAILYSRAKEDDPGLTQKKFGEALNAIANEERYGGGFSESGICTKLPNPVLHRHSKYLQYKRIMRIYADRKSLKIEDAFESFEEATGATPPVDARQEGIWQFLGHPHIKRSSNKGRPNKELRLGLVKFERGGKAASLGVTTNWSGQYDVRGDFTYLQMVERNENLEMFAIFEKPTGKPTKVPRFQRGIRLDVSVDEYDLRYPAIASSRCVLRRLDSLSDLVLRTPSSWKDDLRPTFCGYMLPVNLQKQKLSYTQFSQLHSDDKIAKEQYWFIEELIRTLYEDKAKRNFGTRIILRS